MCQFDVSKVTLIWIMITSRSIASHAAMCDTDNYVIDNFTGKCELLLL